MQHRQRTSERETLIVGSVSATSSRVGDAMTIRWFTDQDRQDMADAAEERAVLRELEERYAVYREDPGIPSTEGMLRLLNGEIDLSPSRRTKSDEDDER